MTTATTYIQLQHTTVNFVFPESPLRLATEQFQYKLIHPRDVLKGFNEPFVRAVGTTHNSWWLICCEVWAIFFISWMGRVMQYIRLSSI